MKYVFLFFALSFLSSITAKNSAIGMIKYVTNNPRYYPKHYVLPARWIRVKFKLKKQLIPKYIYFEIFLSIFYAILGPLNLIISILVNFSDIIVSHLVMFHICLGIMDTIIFSIFSFIYQKR